MKNKIFSYVANWKMNMSFNEALQFCVKNKTTLIELAQDKNNQFILCPEYPIIHPLAQQLKNSNVLVGGQNCSEHGHGAYTGQVSARTLQEAGCTFCIIGHSEARLFFKESNQSIAQKTKRLLEQKISPIICFGETKQEYEEKQTHKIIQTQLASIIETLKNNDNKNTAIYFAYEPIWSIGTGIIAEPDYLVDIFEWIHNHIQESLSFANPKLLYGGSVNPDNAAELKKIKYIDGFLIGGASLDFQKLQKIVLL